MAKEKEKALEKEHGTKPPAGWKEEELSDADVEKVSGGGGDTGTHGVTPCCIKQY